MPKSVPPSVVAAWSIAIFIVITATVAIAFLLWSPNVVAWLSAFLCAAYSGMVARAFLRHSTRLFTVMALFAFSWTLLLPYWANVTLAPGAAVIGVYTSFLSVYIGSLLMLHAQLEQGSDHPHGIVPWQVVALVLLLAVASPSIPTMMGPAGTIFQITTRQFTILIDEFLGLIGFVAVALGIKRCFGVGPGLMIAVIVALYGAVGLAFLILQWPEPIDHLPILTPYVYSIYAYLLSVAKLSYAAAFCSIIAYYGMREADRRAGVWHWALMLVGVQGPLP
jgi:hypothetical protein